MDLDILLPVLTFGTLGAVVIFGMVSEWRTQKRLHDPNSRDSSLARRAPDPNFRPDPVETRKDIFRDR